MDNKEKSLDFDFINFVSEEKTDILSHSLNSSLELETIEGTEAIENLPWEHIKDDMPVDLQLSDFRLIDMMSLTRTSNACSKISTCQYTKSNSEAIKDNSYDTSLSSNYSDATILNSKCANIKSGNYNKVNIFGSSNEENFYKPKLQHKLIEMCMLCNQQFLSLKRKRYHLHKIHKLKLYISCALCNASFFFCKELIKHMSDNHLSETGKYCCIKCNTYYDDYKAISLHLKNHSSVDNASISKSKNDRNNIIEKPKKRLGSNQEKNYSCDKCGKRFLFSCLLKDHMNLHTGVKPYECRICGKSFSQKASIKQHQRTHNPVRPHKCPECPQGFFGKGDLKKHIRLHTGERPYICEMCGESFSQSSHLIAHRRTHTGERPYKCDICLRAFTKNSDVLRHRRIHTGQMPYACTTCGKSFRQSTPFKNHVKTHHSPDIVTGNIEIS